MVRNIVGSQSRAIRARPASGTVSGARAASDAAAVAATACLRRGHGALTSATASRYTKYANETHSDTRTRCPDYQKGVASPMANLARLLRHIVASGGDA